MKSSVAIDTKTTVATDDLFYEYLLRTPLLSIFRVPNQAIIIATPLFHISWRLQRVSGIAQAPGYVRVGRLGFGLLALQ